MGLKTPLGSTVEVNISSTPLTLVCQYALNIAAVSHSQVGQKIPRTKHTYRSNRPKYAPCTPSSPHLHIPSDTQKARTNTQELGVPPIDRSPHKTAARNCRGTETP